MEFSEKLFLEPDKKLYGTYFNLIHDSLHLAECPLENLAPYEHGTVGTQRFPPL